MRRVNLGGSSHLLTLLGPHQIGKLISEGPWYTWGLAWLGFCLVLRVTSGVAFLPLFSESLVTCVL